MSDTRGIACPKCGGETEVTETRKCDGGLRRNRRCESATCDGRLTTYEVPAPPHKAAWRGATSCPLVLVERDKLEELERVIGAALARYRDG